MGKNNKTVWHGIIHKLEGMKAYGQSRHEEKKTGRDRERIYSYNTMNKYRQVGKEFSRWCKKRGVIKMRDVREKDCRDYLLERQEQGKSAYTIQTDMSALNKIFALALTKKTVGLKSAYKKDITRGRTEREYHRHASEETNEKQILIARATGLRRSSFSRLRKEQFHRGKDGLYVSCTTKEKGGKVRTLSIREDLAEDLTKVLEELPDEGIMFEKYSRAINNHKYRREYAQEMYKQYLKGRKDKKDWRGYDKEALQWVSKNLGHNRLDVVVYHYMR